MCLLIPVIPTADLARCEYFLSAGYRTQLLLTVSARRQLSLNSSPLEPCAAVLPDAGGVYNKHVLIRAALGYRAMPPVSIHRVCVDSHRCRQPTHAIRGALTCRVDLSARGHWERKVV